MKLTRWLIGTILLVGGALRLFYSTWPLMDKCLFTLIFTAILAFYRILRGPTAADRAVATDIVGIVVINICVILALFTQKFWYMDIAIAWALQSFIGVLALAKYLEGKNFDD